MNRTSLRLLLIAATLTAQHTLFGMNEQTQEINTSPISRTLNALMSPISPTRHSNQLNAIYDSTSKLFCAEAFAITRSAVKAHEGQLVCDFPQVRNAFEKNRNTSCASLHIAGISLSKIINRDRSLTDEQKRGHVILLASEVTREFIIRNLANPTQEITKSIDIYKNHVYLLCDQDYPVDTPPNALIKEYARHRWGECSCPTFNADPILVKK